MCENEYPLRDNNERYIYVKNAHIENLANCY